MIGSERAGAIAAGPESFPSICVSRIERDAQSSPKGDVR
jgi:hypothetical protein